MNYKYGIVIVTYNRLELLRECIDHAVNQTFPAQKIIIVNNCSTDGTKEYLAQYDGKSRFLISHETTNLGGAGGFARGIQLANEETIDWIMLIDDDAILDCECMENMDPNTAKNIADAYACTVMLQNRIDISHRRNIDSNIGAENYVNSEFRCELATFCGLLFRRSLIDKIGYPEERYFIWFDDSEYCMRINKYSPIIVRTNAILNHKTDYYSLEQKRKESNANFQWKDYYGIRNSIHAYKKHGYNKKFRQVARRTVKQIVICNFRGLKNKEYAAKAQMLKNALKDALIGNLGKNPNYYPGMKR